MNLREGMGFENLSAQERQAYKVMLSAFSSMAVSFKCSQISSGVDLMKVLNTVLGDNPSIIYFDKTKLETENSIFGKQIILKGVHSKPQAERMNLELNETVNKIVSSLRAKSNDEYSLLINLYESIQKNVRYDKEEIQANSRGAIINLASHNAYGALVNKLAVCDGFSLAFALLVQKLGFECMLVVGRSTYASTTFQEHAWNIVKIRNRYYHIDITLDTIKYNEFDEFSYVYFAVTDEEISKDHNWNKTTIPVCSSSDFSYYARNGLYANTAEQLNEIIKAHVRKNANVFRIKLSRNINLPSNAENYLVQTVLNEVVKPGTRARASYGWNENTKCFFAKII